MVLIAVIALLIWICAGAALFLRNAKPTGASFTRAVDRALMPVGETVRVSLRLTPPSSSSSTVDAHDVVLLLDHSPSMGDGPGSALSDAIRAAANFVRRCPESVRVGLIIFDDTGSVLTSITSDHSAVLRALETIGVGNGTSIHAALAAAVELVASAENAPVRTTAILLSDGASSSAPALEQAERLRERARIVTIGLGASANAQLLTAIAGPTGRFFAVDKAGELLDLFTVLASFISAEPAVSGTIEEPVSAPAPFQLAHTGTFHPIAVRGDAETTVGWSVPVMDPRAVTLEYDLVPECPGWHSVARAGGRAVWQLPDGSQQTMAAPTGPRVLVLPSFLVWSWPVLNPLFWMLFGRFFCRARREVRAELPALEPEPLTIPTLPTPLEPPQPALYETRVRPALIVGIGEAGEWAVTHLGHLLADRGVGRDTVSLLAVRATFEGSRGHARIGAFELDPHDRIEVRQDLRPYLETLRKDVPPVRQWIPLVEWLGRAGPRTTDWIDDRREARLALLQRPDQLEARCAAAVEALRTRGVDETALVIGSAIDPECSGMLAEVAHVLSVAGAQTSAIIARPNVADGRGAGNLEALANELERMLLMRGDEVLSDRHEPPASARQLLDRLVVVREDSAAPADAARAVADVAWQLLAYPDLLRRVPMAHADAARRLVECCAVEQSTTHLPAETLWRWVRARALSRAIHGVWLGMKSVDGALHVPAPPHEAVAKWVGAFWAPAGLPRPQSLLLRSGAGLIDETASESAVLALRGRLPVHALYEQQAGFADRERQTLACFLEAWSQALLDEAYARLQCGLPLLIAALREVENGFAAIERRLGESVADSAFAAAGRLALSLYSDLGSSIARFRQNAEALLASLTRALIEEARREAEADIVFPTQAARDEAERHETAWYQHYGAALLSQLRVRAVPVGRSANALLELSGNPVGPDLLAALEAYFASYRAEVLTWDIASALKPSDVDQPSRRCRIGAPAARVFPDIVDVAEEQDPWIAASLLVDRVPVNEALGVRQGGVRRLPYAWPEEANAVRVSALVTNVLSLRPHPFSPAAVHLLRDTGALHAFFADLAEQRISVHNGRCWLSRNGTEYWIGESAAVATPRDALANFERIARQVAILGRSLDAVPIPVRSERWTPDEAVALVEANAIVHPVASAEGWEMWRDIIRGVVLDAGQAS